MDEVERIVSIEQQIAKQDEIKKKIKIETVQGKEDLLEKLENL